MTILNVITAFLLFLSICINSYAETKIEIVSEKVIEDILLTFKSNECMDKVINNFEIEPSKEVEKYQDDGINLYVKELQQLESIRAEEHPLNQLPLSYEDVAKNTLQYDVELPIFIVPFQCDDDVILLKDIVANLQKRTK